MTDYDEDARVFKALCDEKRLAILAQLRSGEKCACVLPGPDAIGAVVSVVSYEDTVRLGAGDEPAGGQVDALSLESRGPRTGGKTPAAR